MVAIEWEIIQGLRDSLEEFLERVMMDEYCISEINL
jgi:hypothetical protein